MTLSIAYTAGGVTNFVETQDPEVFAAAQTPAPNPDAIASWAQEVKIAESLADASNDGSDHDWAMRKTAMAENAGVSLAELNAIKSTVGLSWRAMQLLVSAMHVAWYDRGG